MSCGDPTGRPVPNSGNIDNDVQQLLSSTEDKEIIVEMMREQISFSEEAIVRFTKARLQIDTNH
jgi:hypothetical protein